MTDEIWRIFEDAFTPELRRSREEQTALLRREHYNFDVYKGKDGEAQAFLAWWDFGDFVFGEHLAVDEKLRGRGIGQSIVRDMLSKNSTVVIEVEEPDSEIDRRRIAFYERNGFVMNGFTYFQPPYSAGNPAVKLKIMASRIIASNEFAEFRNKIFSEVYRMDDFARKNFIAEHKM